MKDQLAGNHIEQQSSVMAHLNFAADKMNGGIWCNYDRSLITQKLEAHEVEIRDAKHLPAAPTLEQQGFELHHLPLSQAGDWTDTDWLDRVYIPESLDLVRQLTKAMHVTKCYGLPLIRDTGNPERAPAAEFVHFDGTREAVVHFIEMAADAEIRRKYPRVKMFNIWRVITLPPQDVPLALCDQRTLDEDDWVVGRTIEPNYPDGIPYLTAVFNGGQNWHYFSDLTPDDVVVFKGLDIDADAPMGCLHGAFRNPAVPKAIPRASIEFRAFAFFEQ
jgi:hypothetical protein